MKTPKLLVVVPVILIAVLEFFSSSLRATEEAAVVLPVIPIISIRATVPETREPFCDPAICDAAPPPPGVFVISRRGGDLASELSVMLSYDGTASNGIDYAKLPSFVSFRAGATSVELFVEGVFDRLAEGGEVAVAL